jgi:CRISPR/Cas system-associated exonuclease Cas4 (RecB family)
MGRKVNFGRIVADAKKSDEEKTFSLTEEIDKYCSTGGVSAGAFSVLAMKRACKRMLESLDDFNRKEFFTEFFKLYNLAVAPDLRAKNVFHPSGLLDDCSRKLTYDLLGTSPSNKTVRGISGELQRIFDVGSWYHLYFQNILFAMDFLEEAEVPVSNKKKYIEGKADGVFKAHVFGKRAVLEIKSMNSWTFQKAVFKPLKKHEFQASIYARELGIELVYFLYVNKDTSQIRGFLVDTNKEMLVQADVKMDLVIENVEKRTLPPRACKDKLSDNALACPFRELCFK